MLSCDRYESLEIWVCNPVYITIIEHYLLTDVKINNIHGSVFIKAWCAQPQFNTIITDLRESGVEPRLMTGIISGAACGLSIMALLAIPERVILLEFAVAAQLSACPRLTVVLCYPHNLHGTMILLLLLQGQPIFPVFISVTSAA